jgi:hypothetical protein
MALATFSGISPAKTHVDGPAGASVRAGVADTISR